MSNWFEKIFLKSRTFIIVLIAITAVGITVSGIVYRQKFLMILPLYVSLAVMIINSEAMRIGALIGGVNSILYALVYLNYALYAQAVSALVVSFPFQIATFILWSRHRDGASTKFRTMSLKWRMLLGVGLVAIYIPLLIVNMNAGAAFAPIDTAVSILGIVVTVLTMLAFTEYTYLSILNTVLGLTLYILMIRDNPEQLCYLIYTLYSLICIIRAAFNVHRIHKKQRLEAESGEVVETRSVKAAK